MSDPLAELNLPEDVRAQLAELDLELSEGLYLYFYFSKKMFILREYKRKGGNVCMCG